MSFAQTNCVIDGDSLTGTAIECTLESDPVCGDHHPIVHSYYGYIPTVELDAVTISCTISSIVPDSTLNLMGGDNLTFTGTYFPKDMSVSELSIVFDDG